MKFNPLSKLRAVRDKKREETDLREKERKEFATLGFVEDKRGIFWKTDLLGRVNPLSALTTVGAPYIKFHNDNLTKIVEILRDLNDKLPEYIPVNVERHKGDSRYEVEVHATHLTGSTKNTSGAVLEWAYETLYSRGIIFTKET